MEIETKTTMCYHFIPIRAAVIKADETSVDDNVEKTRTLICQRERKIAQPPRDAIWQFHKETQEFLFDPAIAYLSTYPK